MTVSKSMVIAALIVVMHAFMPQPLLAGTVYLFGKIGAYPIGASLEQGDGRLVGWYFYCSQAKQIRLEGRIDPGGTFSLEEAAGDRKTGVFEGQVKDGLWTGTWRESDGTSPLPFSLEEHQAQLKDMTCNYDCAATHRDAEYHYTYTRSLKLNVQAGKVTALEASQQAVNEGLDEQMCFIDLSSLSQVESDAGLLLQVEEDSFDPDAGKCSVRIVGNQDILWVQFGDSADDGNECRSTSSAMFCSPRGFWNDLILNRRTGKCQALQ